VKQDIISIWTATPCSLLGFRTCSLSITVHHLHWVLCSHHGNSHLLVTMFTGKWLFPRPFSKLKALGSRLITVPRHYTLEAGFTYKTYGSCEQIHKSIPKQVIPLASSWGLCTQSNTMERICISTFCCIDMCRNEPLCMAGGLTGTLWCRELIMVRSFNLHLSVQARVTPFGWQHLAVGECQSPIQRIAQTSGWQADL